MATAFTPYSTLSRIMGQKPSWIADPLDQERLASYEIYEKMYWNEPDVFKISLRGSNEAPVYIPSGRTIVNATSQFTASNFGVIAFDRSDRLNVTSDVAAANLVLRDLMARERFRSRFSGNKRYGLIRGDWLWHITADSTKPLGSRITMVALDPSSYFPIFDPNNIDRVIGVHLAEEVKEKDDPAVRRLTYMKTADGGISVEDGIYKLEGWQTDKADLIRQIKPLTMLPASITSLPVYHVKNFEEPGNPFGSSELRGLEQLFTALNQTMSDEDLALALVGVGMYATDASKPRDSQGNEVPWQLGPGRVAHHDGTRFDRLAGVSSVAPYGDHYNRTWEALKQAASTPDVAIGSVDVQVAQSGIALALQMGPMIAKTGEKNELIVETHGHMFYDIINQWYPAYEETTFNNVTVECTVGDAIPVDRTARFEELNDMLDRGVIDTSYYRSEAEKLGYVFPSDIGEKAAAEYAERNQDAFTSRVASEAGGGTEPTDDGAA